MKKLFAERVNLSPSYLQVRLSGRGLGDDQMVMLGRFLDTLFSDAGGPPAGGEVSANIELAENVIGNAGLIAVLASLERNKVSCKCMKLYKNRIGDEGGIRLADVVRRQPSAFEELHLSHNMLTGRTLIAICMALGKHEGYPLVGRNRLYIPCWLRMEYNHIGRPQDVVELLRREGEVPICLADNRDDCGPWRCCQACRTKQGVPKVHLFTVACQCRSRTTNQDDAELREEIRRWGGRTGPPAPSTRLPLARAASGPASTLAAGTGNSPTRPKAGPAAGANSRPVWDIHGIGRSPTAAAAVANGNSLQPEVCPEPSGEDKPKLDLGGPTKGEEVAAPLPSRSISEPVPDVSGVSEASPSSVRHASSVGDRASGGTFPAAAGKSPVAGKHAAATVSVTGAAGAQPPPPAVSPAAAEACPKEALANMPDTSSEHRASLVTDRLGRRRIQPNQLVGGTGGSNQQFVCLLCSFVMVNPVMTSCSHLFCERCFKWWVDEQVSKQRSRQSAEQKAVMTLPCPDCTTQLQRKDITLLDKADARNGAAALLARLRKNIQVRCVHHRDLFEYPFGKDAEEIARTRRVTCCWVGDLGSYEEHLSKKCEVEPLAAALGGPNGGTAADARFAAAAQAEQESEARAGTSGGAEAVHGQAAAAAGGSIQESTSASPKSTNNSASQSTADASAGTAATQSDTAIAEGGEVRVARYDYTPKETDRAQLALAKDDLVLVYSVTESGWAAGVRIDKKTKEEVGEAGWFPAAYLSPGVHVAAEAA